MSLNDEIILLEYFTANFVAGNHKKQIVKEAQNLVNYIYIYLKRNKNLKKIHLIRNSHSKKINSKKIQNHIITKNKSINFILKKFKKKKIIFIKQKLIK